MTQLVLMRMDDQTERHLTLPDLHRFITGFRPTMRVLVGLSETAVPGVYRGRAFAHVMKRRTAAR